MPYRKYPLPNGFWRGEKVTKANPHPPPPPPRLFFFFFLRATRTQGPQRAVSSLIPKWIVVKKMQHQKKATAELAMVLLGILECIGASSVKYLNLTAGLTQQQYSQQ